MLSRNELAKELAISPHTITSYVQRGMPCERQTPGLPSRFDLNICRQWIAQNVEGDAEGDTDPLNTAPSPDGSPSDQDPDDYETARVKEMESRTALNLHKLNVSRARYISRKAAKLELSEACTFISGHMRAIGDDPAIPEDSRDAVKTAIDRGLTEFADLLDGATKRIAQKQIDHYAKKVVADDR